MTDQQEAERVRRPWWRRMVFGAGLAVAVLAVAAVTIVTVWIQESGFDFLFSSGDETAQSSGSFGLGSDIIRPAADEPSYYWTVIEDPDFSCTSSNDEFEELAEGGMNDVQNVLVSMMAIQEQLCLHEKGLADTNMDVYPAVDAYNDRAIWLSESTLNSHGMPLLLLPEDFGASNGVERIPQNQGELQLQFEVVMVDANNIADAVVNHGYSPGDEHVIQFEYGLRRDLMLYNDLMLRAQALSMDTGDLPVWLSRDRVVEDAMAALQTTGD